jgi:hypothetical protein
LLVMKKIEKQKEASAIPLEYFVKRVLWIRGKKVMLDRDLAELYGVMTRNLNKAVKRNLEHFPEDFMFQLTEAEFDSFKGLMFQIGTSKRRGGTRKRPFVFTELGIAMLSSVLNSQRAIQVNMHIMRAFVQLREILVTHKELSEKIEKMEREYDRQFKRVFDVMQNSWMKNSNHLVK